MLFFFFFFNDTATTEIYPLPLHDALPIYFRRQSIRPVSGWDGIGGRGRQPAKFPVVAAADRQLARTRSEEHTSELQSPCNLVCRLLLEKKKNKISIITDLSKQNSSINQYS